MKRKHVILVGGIIIVIVGIALRVWWYWPEKLGGGPLLENIEKRGHDYSLYLKPESSLSDIADLVIFEGYSPSKHIEFKEKMEDEPSQFVHVSNHYHYLEYIAKHGRMQFHEEEGDSWFEFIPTDLPVDSFLRKDIAINLDLNQPDFIVYIPLKREHMHMTIYVKNRKVDRIAWLEK
jgi:hypothetical protein